MQFKLEHDAGVAVATACSKLNYLRAFQLVTVDFQLDPYLRGDNSLTIEDELVEAVANALADPLITAINDELQPEQDDPTTRIGKGELWVVHKPSPTIYTLGGAQIYAAEHEGIAIIGETSYDTSLLKNMYRARADWALARFGAIKKEHLDVDQLRQGDPPM